MVLLCWLGPALAADGGAEDPLASRAQRGWYLWRTGQDEAAEQLAEDLAAEAPRSLVVHRLRSAMAVAAGDGASNEARTREWWAEDPNDPIRRVALAWAITWRHAEPGPWCDEVASLVEPVVDGEPHYWGTLAHREQERRCTGDTDHADAELRRLLASGGIGAADGVLAKVDAGYIKEDVPEELEKVLAAEPWRVDRIAPLWSDGASGPARGAARRVARQALAAAEESDDPVVVHAALRAHRALGDDKAADAAALQLQRLDPAADPSLDRTEADLRDPEVYTRIDRCVRESVSPPDGLACIEALELPAAGSIAAHAAYQRSMLARAGNLPDELYEATRAAHVADPTVRHHARQLAKLVLERVSAGAEVPADDLSLALEAADAALAGRIPAGDEPLDPEALPERVRSRVVGDLVVRGRLRIAADRAEEALRDLRWARTLGPSPARQLLVGLALAALGRTDEAGMELAWGLAQEVADTELIRLARDALRPIAEGWVPGGPSGMIDAVKRAPGAKGPPHPLIGEVIRDPALLPTPPEAPDPEAPRTEARVVVAWAGWAPGAAEALARVANLARMYGPKGVEMVALDVAAAESAWPEGVTLDHRHAGPGAMRALRSVALPTVIVLDRKGRVTAGLSPYDPGSLDLEAALDALLPED